MARRLETSLEPVFCHSFISAGYSWPKIRRTVSLCLLSVTIRTQSPFLRVSSISGNCTSPSLISLDTTKWRSRFSLSTSPRVLPSIAGFATLQAIRYAFAPSSSLPAASFSLSMSICSKALSAMSTMKPPSTPSGYATTYADASLDDASKACSTLPPEAVTSSDIVSCAAPRLGVFTTAPVIIPVSNPIS